MKKDMRSIPNSALIKARTLRGWSQKDVAEQLGIERYYVSRWERGATTPRPHYRQKLCTLFGMDAQELGLLPPSLVEQGNGEEPASEAVSQPPSLARELPQAWKKPQFWYVPVQRNPFFTGREDLLAEVHSLLHPQEPHALRLPVALSGMGGIGKTQLACEYAYRYASSYPAVFWLRAENRDLLSNDLISLADILAIPHAESDPMQTLKAVQRWLKENTGWLLLLDNVEDLDILSDLLPVDHAGYILLTTQLQATGTLAERLLLEQMTEDEGVVFLLRRAKFIRYTQGIEAVAEPDQSIAREIVRLAGGLPLALDQAGAYIEETGCRLIDYLEYYQGHQPHLLDRRGEITPGHPRSVKATISMACSHLEQAHPLAMNLLRLCAFLHPDAIPPEMLSQAESELGPEVSNPLQLNSALAELRKYSLIQRNSQSGMISMHRLVQMVIRDSMDEETQRQWAEQAISAVNRVFPDVEDMRMWEQCHYYLPQATHCISLFELWQITSSEARRLLRETGAYLKESGQLTQAAALLTKVRDMTFAIVGDRHPEYAACLVAYGEVCREQGKDDLARELYKQAIEIYEASGTIQTVPGTIALMNLGAQYYQRREYVQAEEFLQRAFMILQDLTEPLYLALCLLHLGFLSYQKRNFVEAEQYYLQSLSLYEEILGEHPRIAVPLRLISIIYGVQGRYELAEIYIQQALQLTEKTWGTEHPDMAANLNLLATLYTHQGKYLQAETLLRQTLALKQRLLGPVHPDVGISLRTLGMLYKKQGRILEAISYYQEAVDILEQALEPEHQDRIATLQILMQIYQEQGEHEKAQELAQRIANVRVHQGDIASTQA